MPVVVGIRFEWRYPDDGIPMLTAVLPVSAPANDRWARSPLSPDSTRDPNIV